MVKNNVENIFFFRCKHFCVDRAPEDTPRKIGVGVCSLLPKTVTLVTTKICHFPYPIYDLTKNLIPSYDLTLR